MLIGRARAAKGSARPRLKAIFLQYPSEQGRLTRRCIELRTLKLSNYCPLRKYLLQNTASVHLAIFTLVKHNTARVHNDCRKIRSSSALLQVIRNKTRCGDHVNYSFSLLATLAPPLGVPFVRPRRAKGRIKFEP